MEEPRGGRGGCLNDMGRAAAPGLALAPDSPPADLRKNGVTRKAPGAANFLCSLFFDRQAGSDFGPWFGKRLPVSVLAHTYT